LDQSDAMFQAIISRMEFELSDWSNPNKVTEFGMALNANAVVLGRMMTLGEELIITARINTLNTEIQAANNMVVRNVSEVLGKLPDFTREIVSNLPRPPIPNPFIGRWRSTVTSNGQTLICILNFNSDGRINVERYDTNKVTRRLNGLSYSNDIRRGRGNGTYSYRENSNSVTMDISLTISGVSHEFTAVTARGSFYIRSPNQFTVDSMQCEFYVTEGELSDSYTEFNKL